MRKGFFIIILIIIEFTTFANAEEHREFYNGIRALGMGGAGIAVVNDETALLVNPAGLGKIRDFFGTMIDPELDISNNATTIYSAKPFSNPTSMTAMEPSLDAKRNTYSHARMQIFPSLVVRNFGIGLYSKYQLDAIKRSDTEYDVDYYNDMSLVLGYNFRFWDGRIKLGLASKLTARVEVAKTIDPTTESVDLNDHAKEGVGVGNDVGLILTAPWKMLPTIAVVARDIGGNTFSSSKGVLMETAETPTPVEQDIDVALAIFPIHANRVRSSWTLEYRGITSAAEEEFKMKRYHFGTEFNYADTIFLRAGLNQNYWTAGVEFATQYTQVQFASYGEEIGTVDDPKEDRRFVMKFALRF